MIQRTVIIMWQVNPINSQKNNKKKPPLTLTVNINY
jgi:hypothetical protein